MEEETKRIGKQISEAKMSEVIEYLESHSMQTESAISVHARLSAIVKEMREQKFDEALYSGCDLRELMRVAIEKLEAILGYPR